MPAIDFLNLEADTGLPSPTTMPFFGPDPSLGTVVASGTPPFNTLEELMAYYSNGFLPAGGGQIGGGSLLDKITGIAGGVLQAVLAPRAVTPVQQFAVPAPISRTVSTAVERGVAAITRTAEQHPVLTAAGGAAATAAGGVMATRTMRGRRGPTITQHPDGTVRVHHHRRMNACNIHALRRSIRRLHSFERIARRVLHFVSPKKAHGVAHFKRARKRRTV